MKHMEKRTPKLAIVADDITGAFDTGVQFSKRGSKVCFATGARLWREAPDADVIVIDAETRHLSGRSAYDETFRLVRWARERGIPHLYVKTDSGLRGNIGPALRAAMDAAEENLIAYAPAYPAMNRITRGGMQYVDGMPASESVFGQDLFDPVLASSIRDLIEPAGITVQERTPDAAGEIDADTPTAIVFDAQEDGDLRRIAQTLKRSGRFSLLAGCAGFASVLPAFLGLPDRLEPAPSVNGPLLVVCGSLNPITQRQIQYAERIGYTRVVLTREQLLSQAYPGSDGEARWLRRIGSMLARGVTVMLDTGFLGEEEPDTEAAAIAARLGLILTRVLELRGISAYTPMLIGGDTMMGFLRQLDAREVVLEGEVDTGVVVLRVVLADRSVRMLSKSGGLGSETLFRDIAHGAMETVLR